VSNICTNVGLLSKYCAYTGTKRSFHCAHTILQILASSRNIEYILAHIGYEKVTIYWLIQAIADENRVLNKLQSIVRNPSVL
jgi:hypothetical protein